ncbi:MAG TPA: MmcQ/YjbR family DNA-binding protein [Candidatus Kapabacteria bacterium]|nr:MmcQ/YjbR family DNA-binding protein [Candidatus Kapabacteria bacterium]
MTLDDIRAHCLALPGTTEDSPWEDHFAYKVGGKMYVITSATNPVSMSIKCSEEDFNELIEREGIKPAPYLAKHKWVQLERANVVNARELKTLLTKSYEIIKSKLSKKLQRELEA